MIITRWTPVAVLAAVLCASGCGESSDTKPSPDSTPAASASQQASTAPSAAANPSASSVASADSAPATSATTESSADPTSSAASTNAPSAKTAARPTPPSPSPISKPDPTPPPKVKPSPPPPVAVTTTIRPPAPPPPPPPAKEIKLKPAKPGSASEVAEKVDVIYKPITTFRARFEQKYVAKVAGKTKKSSGVVYIMRPGKLSFSYHKPNQNRVVSDGNLLKIYEHENKQMFVKKVANTQYPGALAFIMGKGLRQNFKFKFHKTAKWEGGPVLVGKPRVDNPGYKTVLFYIDEELLKKGEPGCMRRVLVLDAQGNRNRFDFIRVEVPDKISPTEFSFEPPPGTEIIK